MKPQTERAKLVNKAMRAALKARRAALGMEIKDIAAQTGMHPRTVANYMSLKADNDLNYVFLDALALALKTSVNELSIEAMRLATDPGFLES